MTQQERLSFLINYLIQEDPQYNQVHMPLSIRDQKRLLRTLMNLRPPEPASPGFLQIQDEYLEEERAGKHITEISDLTALQKGSYLWQGDITLLRADAIVNAANSTLLGCFVPCHGCIDNAIHSAAGIQLRSACHRLMGQKANAEPVGTARITDAYNLPSRYIIHTVGPYIRHIPTEQDCHLLASCYHSCLALADSMDLRNIAFCCISTGEFHFPNRLAAQTALNAVTEYRRETHSEIEVIYNVYKDIDYEIYRELLQPN